MRFTSIRSKQVINIADGTLVGYTTDAVLSMPEGTLEALVVESWSLKRWLPFLWGGLETLVPMSDVVHMGEDVILVKIHSNQG